MPSTQTTQKCKLSINHLRTRAIEYIFHARRCYKKHLWHGMDVEFEWLCLNDLWHARYRWLKRGALHCSNAHVVCKTLHCDQRWWLANLKVAVFNFQAVTKGLYRKGEESWSPTRMLDNSQTASENLLEEQSRSCEMHVSTKEALQVV